MESFFSRYRNALVLIGVLVAQLLALAVQARRPAADGAEQHTVSLARYVVVTVITPPERLLYATGHWISSVWFGYIDLIHVRRDNASLKQEIERLRLEQASLAQDAQQAQRLQHMLGFEEHYIYKTLPAQVIGTGGSDQSQVLYIDKGSEDGMQQDMPVITADGIVGKVKDVFPHTSQVLLVTDPTSGVGVILETTRIRGILKGREYGQLQVVDVSPDSRIKAGEQIITSGGDQVFPRGLPVGTVESVVPDPEHDPLVDVLVRPAAKLSQLEEVMIITNLGDAMSPQEVKDLAESEAESEAEQKRASDVLAERLPSRIDPNAPADTNPEQLVDAQGNPLKPMVAPKPDHPDRFSPNAEPDATEMVPGQRWAPVKEGTEDIAHPRRPQPAQNATAAPASGTASGTAPGTATAPGGAAPVHANTSAVQPAASTAAAGKIAHSGAPSTASKTEPDNSVKTHVVVDGPVSATHKATTPPPSEAPTPAANETKPRSNPPPASDNSSPPPQPASPPGGMR
ncbi:MAG TPA: rod shape-determining protein MreC [Alloacidobacterium sp.]|nr:rod shape-determining protein MreC [Alloacidobacterium sp.]